MKKYTWVGYINHPTIAKGFLIPIYKYGKDFFFHSLSEDKRHISGFTHYYKEDYSKDEFVPVTDVIEKSIGSPSFFVFKNGEEIIYGSCNDKDMIHQMIEVANNTSTSYLGKEIAEIFF